MKIYDAGKVALGLLIFFAVMASPFLHALYARSSGLDLEDVVLVEGIEGDCAVAVDVARARGDEVPADREERLRIARTEHMELLDDWRDEVVREGKRLRVGMHEGAELATKSLSNTCLECHTNKVQFCDRCHDNSGVAPYCWDCHVDPVEVAGR